MNYDARRNKHVWLAYQHVAKEGCTTHLVLLQHHKVEMLDALFRVFSHALHKGRIRNDVTDVFVNERIPAAIPVRVKKNEPHIV
jgi:hypothetical protein